MIGFHNKHDKSPFVQSIGICRGSIFYFLMASGYRKVPPIMQYSEKLDNGHGK